MSIEECDAYTPICILQPRNCPRHKPILLYGVSIVELLRLEPIIANAICTGCSELVKELRDVLRMLGSMIAEEWRYHIFNENDEMLCFNTASLPQEVRQVIEAMNRSRQGALNSSAKSSLLSYFNWLRDALEGFKAVKGIAYLSSVRAVDVDTREEDKELQMLVNRASNIVWNVLNSVRVWRIVVGNIGVDEGLRREVEDMLNTMYSKGLGAEPPWLTYRSHSGYITAVQAIAETIRVVNVVSRGSESINPLDYGWRRELIRTFTEVFHKEATVLEKQLDALIHLLSAEPIFRKVVGLPPENALKTIIEKDLVEAFTAVLGGQWELFAEPEKAVEIFKRIVEELERLGYGYKARIYAKNYKHSSKIQILVEVPSILALNYVEQVMRIIKASAEETGLKNYRLLLKPVKPSTHLESSNSQTIEPYILITTT
ncbi:MAG: hypothetical protein JHC33_15445 [Ignisphaera sp.]|nr:hypothetical protein [Ignisphaera sp.]